MKYNAIKKPYLLIPMSGFGKRFIDYGIDIDKQILEFTDTITPFEKSLNSLKNKSDFINLKYTELFKNYF